MRLLIFLIFLFSFTLQAEPRPPYNTTKGDPPSPEQSLAGLHLPPGFKATVFAAEPDVQQPISMATDARGRLWVAECYSYGEAAVNFAEDQRDRVIILEDSKHTGHFDKRTVFWDEGRKLTSVLPGFGGVWVLCAPKLLFIPMKEGEDKPSGPPQVVLDGWNENEIRHNVVNGLQWGPDGWLYGRHGIQGNSFVGAPGTPKEQRTALNCCIWRFHPVTKKFEVVCQGGTNPWGMDWNEDGEPFFCNSVNGHLWHAIPGAYFKRMYGEPLRQHTYSLMDMCADHVHYATGETWGDAKKGLSNGTDAAGGGHAHCGLLIYQGGNWPAEYNGAVLTPNLHGRRINHDVLERRGSGYVAKHGPDFARWDDPWFRGVDIQPAPDGGVYVADFSDTGECHQANGVHRTSGRIYHINYVWPEGSKSSKVQGFKVTEGMDLRKLKDAELVDLLTDKNIWPARQARLILQERAVDGRIEVGIGKLLERRYGAQTDDLMKLRLLWGYWAVMGKGDGQFYYYFWSQTKNDHLRVWTMRFLTDDGFVKPESAMSVYFRDLSDSSPLARLYFASALQKTSDTKERLDSFSLLFKTTNEADDANLPLMLWYAIEPLVITQTEGVMKLFPTIKIPLVKEFIARRLTEEIGKTPAPVETLLTMAMKDATGKNYATLGQVLKGMESGMRGWRKAAKPKNWDAAKQAAEASGDEGLAKVARALGAVFGDGRALDELKKIAQDKGHTATERQAALLAYAEAQPPDLADLLHKLINDRDTAPAVVRAFAGVKDDKAPGLILGVYTRLNPEDRSAALQTLVGRPASAAALLEAMGKGVISRNDLSAYQARQIRQLNDEKLNKQLTEVWGELRESSADKLKLREKYRDLLTDDRLAKADTEKGRTVFQQVCAVCHKLKGEGAAIGPDLTGGNRQNLEYLLENITDPSAIVPADYRLTVVTMKDGRALSGIVPERNERTLTLQTPAERLTLLRAEITKEEILPISLMPEGLMETLNEAQVADLIKYLRTP